MLTEYALHQPRSQRVFSIVLYNAVVLICACSKLYLNIIYRFRFWTL